MAYTAANLARIGGANGFSLWVYKTADTAADVDTAGYFNSAAKVLNIGDMIIRQTFTSTAFTAISTMGLHYVNANDGTTVDVTDTLALTATDTD